MSTQLDPVTGAPLLTTGLGNIDQLPYKVQPVPLQDQTNQPQLGRAYLYPDDVPPVLANINAMNGTQPDQAQTLHTDGEHRLLVSSGSSGGGVIVAAGTGWGDQRLDIDVNHHDSFSYDPFAYVISISLSVTIEGVHDIADLTYGSGTLDYSISGTFGILTLAVSASRDGNTLHGVTAAHGIWQPPYPVDISSNVPGWPTFWDLVCYNNTPFRIETVAQVVAGPVVA